MEWASTFGVRGSSSSSVRDLWDIVDVKKPTIAVEAAQWQVRDNRSYDMIVQDWVLHWNNKDSSYDAWEILGTVRSNGFPKNQVATLIARPVGEVRNCWNKPGKFVLFVSCDFERDKERVPLTATFSACMICDMDAFSSNKSKFCAIVPERYQFVHPSGNARKQQVS